MNDSRHPSPGTTPPHTAPPSPHRWTRRVGGVLALAVVALAACEVLGWPFLAEPVQRFASEKLDRRVSFVAGAASQPVLRLHLIGGVRVKAPSLTIAAPTWSTAPYMVQATGASLALRYTDLWRASRGEPLHIQSLRADTLEVELERQEDGRASWQFGETRPKAADEPAPALPTFGTLEVADGRTRYHDELQKLTVAADFSLAEGRASGPPAGASSANPPAAGASAPPPGLHARATGSYRDLPLRAELSSSGVTPWTAEGTAAPPVPVTLTGSVGRARLDFHGQVVDPLHMTGLRGRYALAGPSLAAVGDPIGVTLPTTGAFQINGRLSRQADLWNVVVSKATVGSSRLEGAFRYDAGRKVPLLAGRIAGSRVLLADLAPTIGAPADPAAPAAVAAAASAPAVPARPGKVLPNRPFDLPSLRAMDANVLVDFDDLQLGTVYLEPLRPLRAHLVLQGGVLAIRDIDARTADGRLSGRLQLDGRAEAAQWQADLRWGDVRLERWIRQTRSAGAPPYVSGRLTGRAQLTGQGRSTADILATLNGNVRTQLRGGTVSHLGVEAAGLDVAQALGMLVKGDDSLKVDCAFADIDAKQGVLRPRAFVLDTADSAVLIDGRVSLVAETMDLRAVVAPKDFSPMALRTPVHVAGTFGKPDVSLEKGPLARKIGAAALLALINPLAAIIPFIDLGDAGDAQRADGGCAGLAKRAAGAERS